ncbi:hypothetical protein CL614_00390 [archaeon]|nr:hypothetical protein [archaeon]|tara:strand:- start:493 stop:720 length:228 start_codon:yes stop_codon:yes gene_type:complete
MTWFYSTEVQVKKFFNINLKSIDGIKYNRLVILIGLFFGEAEESFNLVSMDTQCYMWNIEEADYVNIAINIYKEK